MGAPKKNEFWKMRSKHGRNPIIESAEILQESAYEYFQWCVDNPVHQNEFRGKDALPVWIEHPRVFTKSGVALYCGMTWETIDTLRAKGKDFSDVITHIEEIIKTQKFTYAAVNMFNANIIARDLGIKDNKEIEIKDTRKEVSDLFPVNDDGEEIQT
jgi:hypothetical protein